MRHQIVELPNIPREKKALQAIIGEARLAARRRKIQLYAAIACLLLGCAILVWTFGISHAKPSYRRVLPMVVKYE